jgi:hypothetical protein
MTQSHATLVLCLVIYSDCASASLGSVGASATRYRRAEYVRVPAIVVTPFKFRDVQRQIFAADFVEAAHDATFQERPEAVNRLSMNRAVDILASAMPHSAVLFQLAISWVFISCNQAHFFRDCFADKAVQGFCIGMRDNARHHIAFAFDGANDGVLAFSAGSGCALIPMPVFVLAADISFINFDNAHELAKFRFGEPPANAMAHIMRGRVGTKTKHPMHLHCGNALLAGQHQIDDLEPSPHRDIRVFEYRPDKHGKAIAERRALPTLPMERAPRQFRNVCAPAPRTTNTIRPTPRNQVGFASFVRRKEPIELCDGHLFVELCGGHRSALDV